jgi:glycosyltransferase involved in cell wall biosynthesis
MTPKESNLPSISIVMNIWNGAPYLREAIDSVLAQSYSDWELIAWDDCSTDTSADVVRSYADPRIRYFCAEERVPLGRARHLALREVQGEWVAFLDQDDVWHAEKLEKQLALANTSADVGLVYGRTVMFTSTGTQGDFDHRHEFELLPEGAILRQLFVDACFIAMSSALFRRSALDEVGGIPPEIQMSPDYHMYLGVCQKYQARAVQDVICYYRIHSGNMTPRTFKTIHLECLWLINRWSGAVSPRIIGRRRKVHHTLVALKECQERATRGQGLMRLLRDGSLPYLFSRPVVRGYRALRRQMQLPYWKRVSASQFQG